MKKQTTVTDKVAEIDCEISKLNATMARLRDGKAAKEKARCSAEAERDKLLQGDTDVDAEPLKRLRRGIWEINEELKDYDRRIELASTRMENLQTKRGEVYREQKRRELETEISVTIASGKVVEEGLTALLHAVENVRRQVAKMETLALECGEPSDRYRKLLRALWRGFEQRMNLQSPWLERRFRELYKKPIQEVFEAHLKGAIQDEDRNEEERRIA